MVDFHAHILPGADHGSNSIETSLKQVRLAKNAGISTIIATPHFYMNNDSISEFHLRRENSYNELICNMKNNSINLKIIKGCEVNLQIDLFNNKDLTPLCIEKTNYMLLELPLYIRLTKWHFDAIDELRNLGIEPIIAHINRYDDYTLEQVFEKDVKCQINIESFKYFSSRRRVIKFIKHNNAHFLGSDMHGLCGAYDDIIYYSKKYWKYLNILDKNAIKLISNI